jgi:pimeloyl-ACP methyl ester carboxylesterase
MTAGKRLDPTARGLGIAAALALLLALPAPAGAAHTQRAPALKLAGGAVQRLAVCGRARRALIVKQGAAVSARLRPRGRRAVLSIARCRDGRWSRLSQNRFRHRRRARRALPTAAAGDLRVRLRIGRRLRMAYVHVAEDLVDVPVKFRVANVNRSKLSCQSDGGSYTIAGRLTAPRRALDGSGGVTLYLHEFSFGQFFWSWPEERYDYGRALARAGHASVAIDRLGYGASSKPPGMGVCLGSQADSAHQLIGALRAGGYSAGGGPAPRFRKVALAGHSAGGAAAEVEAYSFGDIDALVLFAQADQGFTPKVTLASANMGSRCAGGGDARAGADYAYFSQSDDEFRSFQFRTAESRIANAVTARRNPDPCGDVNSLVPAIAANQANVGSVTVPVLLMYGTGDAVYDQPKAGEDQRKLFSGSKDVTLRFFADQAHGLVFESRAPEVRATAADWLTRRGL